VPAATTADDAETDTDPACAARLAGRRGQLMSHEEVEVVRRWLEVVSTLTSAEAGERFWESDADYYPVRGFPEARPCHGLEQIVQFNVGFQVAWSRYERTPREVVEVGDGRVLACTTLRAEGRESGMVLSGELYTCVWLRHGRFYRVEDHLTLPGALHAFGLAAETLEEAGLRGSGPGRSPEGG